MFIWINSTYLCIDTLLSAMFKNAFYFYYALNSVLVLLLRYVKEVKGEERSGLA